MKNHQEMRLAKISGILILFLISYSSIKAQTIRIIPNPQELEMGVDTFIINEKTKIISSSNSNGVALFLKKYINKYTGRQINILDSSMIKTSNIQFALDKDMLPESYDLIVSKDQIQIIASGTSGWFYGTQSLMQLFPVLTNATEKRFCSIAIPGLVIKDWPRFPWRAFMLDEARHFKGMGQVKMLLDEMAFLKMNVFHWHLVDDQGWRIEIKKYPLLTEIGSTRKSTQIGPLKWQSPIQSAEPHGGFYTQDEIREIVKYAKERCITIVPEIEMPGHSSAAIASYPWLGTNKIPIDVPVKFGVGADVYDVSDPKVYRFLTDVLDEVIDLFPSKVIHIGGDEVKYDHWKSSKTVNAFMREKKLATPADLQVFFTNSISQYLERKGRRMMGWNEILGHNIHQYQSKEDAKSDQQLAGKTIVQFWKGDVELIKQAAMNGYDIVNSWNKYTYLDKDYDEIPLSKAYSFDPVPAGLDPKFHHKIIGVGCQMWGEWIPTNGQMHYLVFPRIAAYAEVGWTEKRNMDFDSFKLGLNKIEQRWTQKGIYYAPDSFVEKSSDSK